MAEVEHNAGGDVGHEGNISFTGFDFTGIKPLYAEPAAKNSRYDLQGRKAASDAKGVVIENGRKELVK